MIINTTGNDHSVNTFYMSTVQDIFDSKSDPMHCMRGCTFARAHTHTHKHKGHIKSLISFFIFGNDSTPKKILFLNLL